MKRISVLLIFFLVSCSTTKRSDLLKATKDGYSINLNSNSININEVFLDRKNIMNASINKNLKVIDLEQKNKESEFVFLNKFDNTKEYGKVNLIVIDGEPISSNDYSKIKIETSSIKELTFLKYDSTYIFCRNFDNIVVIKTNAH